MSTITHPARDEQDRDVPAGRVAPAADVRSLASVGHELDIGASIIGIAVVALRASLECLAIIKVAVAGVMHSDGDRGSAYEAVANAQARLRQLSLSSSFNGVNLLCSGVSESDRINVVSAVARDLNGALSIKSIEVDRRSTALFDLSQGFQSHQGFQPPQGILDRIEPATGMSIVTIDLSRLDQKPDAEADRARIRRQVDAAIVAVHRVISQLSIVQSRINLQSSFIASLAETCAAESAALVDANFDQDMTKQTAMHTVRLLHAHARSIASLNRQTVLKLFKDD